MERGEKILTSLIQLWAHQNNQEIEQIEIWKKGEERENAKRVHPSSRSYSSSGGMYCDRNPEHIGA
ncbi:MAG: hypothetical protein IJ675_03990 [Pseudobutyrivibrio sp.]|nr:hypothetical protein [Pseudobutyrivibrio sp.]